MIQRFSRRRTGEGGEDGFTLVELLVVIIILGILAAVVVFAVGGIGDKGEKDACKIDTRTIRTAQEAYYAAKNGGNGKYGNEEDLSPKFLSEKSTLHNTTASADGKDFTITVQDSQCGTVNADVDTSPDDNNI